MPDLHGEDEAPARAREYAAAREAAAVVDLEERALLEVTGPQREKFLHNILSNDVVGRKPGEGCLAALMDPKGHVVALMRVLACGDAVRLELPAKRVAVVHDALVRYRVGAPVRFAARPAALFGVLGPSAAGCLEAAGLPIPPAGAESHAGRDGGALLVARASDLPNGGFVVHATEDEAPDLWSSLVRAGALPLGRRALDALRVETGCAWYGYDVSDQNLLHETGLLETYHSASKGCYVGQEVVARLQARGANVNKMLRGLRLDGPAQAGDALRDAEREVGRVTTAAESPRLGPIAMAYVQRSHAAPGSAVVVAGHAARVSALPFEP